jgi:hypothetical protein
MSRAYWKARKAKRKSVEKADLEKHIAEGTLSTALKVVRRKIRSGEYPKFIMKVDKMEDVSGNKGKPRH